MTNSRNFFPLLLESHQSTPLKEIQKAEGCQGKARVICLFRMGLLSMAWLWCSHLATCELQSSPWHALHPGVPNPSQLPGMKWPSVLRRKASLTWDQVSVTWRSGSAELPFPLPPYYLQRSHEWEAP